MEFPALVLPKKVYAGLMTYPCQAAFHNPALFYRRGKEDLGQLSIWSISALFFTSIHRRALHQES